jgi:hypothetical protein
MRYHNATNERIKRRYFAYLTTQGHSEQPIDAVAKASRAKESSRILDLETGQYEASSIRSIEFDENAPQLVAGKKEL